VRETLYFRLRDPAADASIDYAVAAAEAGTALTVGSATLTELGRLAATRRTIVFVPTVDVRLLKVTVPARQPGKVLQAAPYLLEDQFADDVETLHFALGPRQADGSHPIAAIGRSRFESWLQLLRAHRIEPDLMIPEVLALPWPGDDALQALAEPDLVTVRNGAYAGFAAEPQDLEAMLNIADPGETPRPLRILIAQNVGTDYTRLPRPVELRPGYGRPIEALARNFRQTQAIDLLQGEYAVRESWRRYLAPWRAAGIAAAALLACSIVANVVYAIHDNRAANTQEQTNIQRFQALFPSQTANPALLSEQLTGLLKNAQSGNANGLFYLIDQFQQAQQAAPGLTLKNLQFRDGALYLNLTGSDLQVVERVRGWFAKHPGTKLTVVNEDSGANGVQIRLKLEMA
jgi:general secretion pathway protein L